MTRFIVLKMRRFFTGAKFKILLLFDINRIFYCEVSYHVIRLTHDIATRGKALLMSRIFGSLPIDRNMKWHQIMSYCIFIFTILHFFSFLLDGWHSSKGHVLATGALMIIVLVLIIATSMTGIRRGTRYETFL